MTRTKNTSRGEKCMNYGSACFWKLGANGFTILCPLCEEGAPLDTASFELWQHMWLKHKSENEKFLCGICQKKPMTHEMAIQHIRSCNKNSELGRVQTEQHPLPYLQAGLTRESDPWKEESNVGELKPGWIFCPSRVSCGKLKIVKFGKHMVKVHGKDGANILPS